MYMYSDRCVCVVTVCIVKVWSGKCANACGGRVYPTTKAKQMIFEAYIFLSYF